MSTLDNEQLEAIRSRDVACRGQEYGPLVGKPSTAAYRDRHLLLAEVDRLRAELDATRGK